MSIALKQIMPPMIEPISLDEAKQHLRVDIDAEDDLILSIISAARSRAEGYTGLSLMPQKWMYAMDRFPVFRRTGTAPSRSDFDQLGNSTWEGELQFNRSQQVSLPRSPLISVDLVTYIDLNSQQRVTLAANNYIVDDMSMPGRLVPPVGASWPLAQPVANSVQISFTTGFVVTITESYVVPSSAPYTVTLNAVTANKKVIGISTVIDTTSNQSINYTNADGILTFTADSAGKTVSVTYTISTVPESLVMAIKLMIGAFYENRESFVVGVGNAVSTPISAEHLMNEHRQSVFGFTMGG
jgi:hypothetical protein